VRLFTIPGTSVYLTATRSCFGRPNPALWRVRNVASNPNSGPFGNRYPPSIPTQRLKEPWPMIKSTAPEGYHSQQWWSRPERRSTSSTAARPATTHCLRNTLSRRYGTCITRLRHPVAVSSTEETDMAIMVVGALRRATDAARGWITRYMELLESGPARLLP